MAPTYPVHANYTQLLTLETLLEVQRIKLAASADSAQKHGRSGTHRKKTDELNGVDDLLAQVRANRTAHFAKVQASLHTEVPA